MPRKVLGKIDYAEFGTVYDYPFLIGLQLGFSLADRSYIMSGGKYTVNISPDCEWKNFDRADTVTKTVDHIDKILRDAKVNYVSELINKPVEVIIDDNDIFKDFRILTEVL